MGDAQGSAVPDVPTAPAATQPDATDIPCDVPESFRTTPWPTVLVSLHPLDFARLLTLRKHMVARCPELAQDGVEVTAATVICAFLDMQVKL